MESWLKRICERYGDSFNFPPYPPYFPQDFKIPKSIVDTWVLGRYYLSKENNFFKKVLYIPPKTKGYNRPRRGSYFNGVIGDESKKGIKKVFLPGDEENIWIGSIVYKGSLLGNEPLKKGEVCRGMVYRFEILYTSAKDRRFGCIALPQTFNKENFLDNLSNCNYQINPVPRKVFYINPLKRRKSRREHYHIEINHRSPWERKKGK